MVRMNKPVVINIPQKILLPKQKVEIDGIDVTDNIISINVTPGISGQTTDTLIVIDNRNGRYTAEFPSYSIVKVYIDYDTATKMVFEGRIFVDAYILGNAGLEIELICKGYDYDALRKKVNYSPTSSSSISDLFQYLITTHLNPLYGHSLDFTDIATISTLYQPTWSRKTVLECMLDLMEQAGNTHDFSCDNNKKWSLFIKGSKVSSEAIVYTDNMISCRNVNSDLISLANKISVYGEDVDGIPRFRTFDNNTSQSSYNVSEDEYTDTNISTEAQLTGKGDALLSQKTSLEQKGTCTSIGLPNVLPGEKLYIINPYCNLMGYKRVVDVSHIYDSNGFITMITYEEIEKGSVFLIQQRIKNEVKGKSLWGMENSYIMEFKTDDYGDDTQTPDADAELESMYQTVVWEDRLMLELNTNDGNAVSNTIVTSKNVNSYVVAVKGSNMEGDDGSEWVTVKVNLGNGWKTITKDTITTAVFQSRRIQIKVEIVSLTTKIKSVAFLWK